MRPRPSPAFLLPISNWAWIIGAGQMRARGKASGASYEMAFSSGEGVEVKGGNLRMVVTFDCKTTILDIPRRTPSFFRCPTPGTRFNHNLAARA